MIFIRRNFRQEGIAVFSYSLLCLKKPIQCLVNFLDSFLKPPSIPPLIKGGTPERQGGFETESNSKVSYPDFSG
jgi:hypothetical protein